MAISMPDQWHSVLVVCDLLSKLNKNKTTMVSEKRGEIRGRKQTLCLLGQSRIVFTATRPAHRRRKQINICLCECV